MNTLADLVVAAQAGDVEAYGRLVQATQTMAYAVALSVLRDSASAQDAAQQAYLRAFRRLGDLQDPATFAGWLRRIVITVALNMRRAHRRTLLCLDDVPDVPVLDEAETQMVGGAAAAAVERAADADARRTAALRSPVSRPLEHGAPRGATPAWTTP